MGTCVGSRKCSYESTDSTSKGQTTSIDPPVDNTLLSSKHPTERARLALKHAAVERRAPGDNAARTNFRGPNRRWMGPTSFDIRSVHMATSRHMIATDMSALSNPGRETSDGSRRATARSISGLTTGGHGACGLPCALQQIHRRGQLISCFCRRGEIRPLNFPCVIYPGARHDIVFQCSRHAELLLLGNTWRTAYDMST